VFEAKRGYTAFSSQDLLDYESVSRTQSWIDQAEASRVNAGAAYWAVISKKDRREAVILMPTECFFEINQNYVPLPLFLINLKDDINLVQFLFNDFLKFDPKHIKKVSDDKQINNKELSKTSTLRDRLTKNQCLGGEV
jgi:hypothetical protein